MTRIRSTALIAAVLLLGTSSAEAATRWTAPNASGPEPCVEANPCPIKEAIEGAPSPGDEVIVKPGDYAISSSIFSPKSLDIHGQDGQARPRLSGAAGAGILSLLATPGITARVRYLYFESTSMFGSALHVRDGPFDLSDLVVLLRGGGGAVFFEGSGESSLRDSVARTTGQYGRAVYSTATTVHLRNVTAISSGPDSRGVYVEGFCNGKSSCGPGSRAGTLTARNVIARGTEADLRPDGMEGARGNIDVSYSNYRTKTGPGTVNDQGSNQSAAPLFADETGGDFHQLTGSPTIDAGTADSRNGAFDFDGDPRTLGSAPDIGADEFVPPDVEQPLATGLTLRPSAFRAARSGASLIAAPRTRTTVRYSLSEPAAVRFRVQRPTRGRRVGGRCVRAKRSNRRRPACTRYVTLAGSFSHQGVQGANRFRFTGRLRGRRLRAGRYRLVGTPTDPAGNRGAAVRARFRIVR